MIEDWVRVNGYNNYFISNNGSVKRSSCILENKLGIKHNYKEKVLKPEYNKGYLRYTLSINNTTKRIFAHRLVAEHFLVKSLDKNRVNHIDGNKLNNNYLNLEWCTSSENEIHSYNRLGKINSQRKLNIHEVNDILNNAIKGVNTLDFMIKYNVSRKTILNILNKKTYV